jgi:hypothetical protein
MSCRSNYFKADRFRVNMNRTPAFTANIQGLTIPSLSLGRAEQRGIHGATIKHPGDRADYDDIVIRAILDDRLQGFKEILTWMEEIAPLLETKKVLPQDEHFTDISVTLMNGANNPQVILTFHNAFPTLLNGFDVDSSLSEPSPIILDVTFAYTYYTVEHL